MQNILILKFLFSAKALLNVFPMLAAGLFSMGVIFIQEYINKSKLMKEKEEGKRFFYLIAIEILLF